MIFDVSRWIDAWIVAHSPAFLYSGQFWALCITPLAVAALLSGLRPAARLPRVRAPLFLGLTLATLLAARLPLLCRDHLGVAEAFLLSSAMRLSAGPVTFRAADSGTSGPLNIYVLAIPAWFGSPLSYVSGRLTAILLMFGALAFLWLTVRQFLGHALAVLAVMPALCFVAYARELDFTHASSEHLPVFLWAAACYLLACDEQAGPRASPRRSAVLGAVASAMVFAKLQTLPAAAALLLLAGAASWRKSGRWAALAALCGGAALVPGLFLSLFARYGVLREFWYSYLGRNLAYTGLSGISTAEKFWRTGEMLLYASNMNWYLFGLAPVWLAGLGASAAVASARIRHRPGPQSEVREATAMSAGAVILALAGLAAVAAPGRPFSHYLLLLLVPFALLTASALLWVQIAFRTRSWGHSAGLAAAFFLVATCCLPTILSARQDGDYETAWDMPIFDPATPLVCTIRRYASPGESLVVWGWRSELYVASRRMPGTRFADSVLQIELSPYLAYFRRVYLADFLSSQPPVFVDAVGPGEFAYKDRITQGFEAFGGLREAVLRGYSPVGELAGARIFVRNDRK